MLGHLILWKCAFTRQPPSLLTSRPTADEQASFERRRSRRLTFTPLFLVRG